MKEIWKRIIINGTTTKYEISNFGRCRNIEKLDWKTFGILVPKKNKKSGYCQYCIVVNGKNYYRYAHRLVAEYFVPLGRPDHTEVNHLNGIKQDNHFLNLQWVTKSENMRHAMENNLCSHLVPVDVYSLRGELLARYASISEAIRQLNIDTDNYDNRIAFNSEVSHGYQWRRVGIDFIPVTDVYDKWMASDGCIKLSKDGEYLHHYSKITTAYEDLGVKDNGAISQCCKGNRNSFHGFKWVYAKEYLQQNT